MFEEELIVNTAVDIAEVEAAIGNNFVDEAGVGEMTNQGWKGLESKLFQLGSWAEMEE